MVSRREVIVKSADEYRKASKKDKGQILDRITEITGYNRDYASHLLTLFGKRIYMESKRGARFILEADKKDSKVRRKRKRTYDREVADAVATLWKMMDYICGKRLAAAIPWLVSKLEATKDLFLQVWCSDITYVCMGKGFLYLTVMDWFSRKVLSWELSTTLDTSFCASALKGALQRYGKPEIFNTDQGSLYTSKDFTDILKDDGIDISMDGIRQGPG